MGRRSIIAGLISSLILQGFLIMPGIQVIIRLDDTRSDWRFGFAVVGTALLGLIFVVSLGFLLLNVFVPQWPQKMAGYFKKFKNISR